MIRHIVFWKFLEEAEGAHREENLRLAKGMLEGLKSEIPEILHLEVGVDVTRTPASFDLALNSLFRDVESLAAYQAHPAHMKVVEFLRKVQSARAVADYVTDYVVEAP
jgi:hypothetical protein